jgi:hypothetical protein
MAQLRRHGMTLSDAATQLETVPTRIGRKAELLLRAKEAIACSEQEFGTGKARLRDAAEAIATARQEEGATQREIAKRVGRSPAWVNRLLKWRERGYPDTAFGPASQAFRQRTKKLVQAPEQEPGVAINDQATKPQESRLTDVETEQLKEIEIAWSQVVVAYGKATTKVRKMFEAKHGPLSRASNIAGPHVRAPNG